MTLQNYITYKQVKTKKSSKDERILFLDRDSRSRLCQKVSLNNQENFDNFKKLVSIEKSQFCLDPIFRSQKYLFFVDLDQ
jgi:hypothetical protein